MATQPILRSSIANARRCLVLLGAGVLLSGCAWGEGEPFATLDAHLQARLYEPDDRDLGGGWQRLASSYELHIEQLDIEAGEIELLDAGFGPGAGSFDPANPPPGYGLCHNGHCHADDGRLVNYDQIAAELSQGGSATIVTALPVGELDLVGGESRALACLPDCDLPLANITLLRTTVTRIRIAGLVRDGRSPARIDGELPWQLELSFPTDTPLIWTGLVDLPADRSHEPAVSLWVELAAGSTLFDGVAWSALDTGDGTYDVAADAEARAAVLTALGEVSLATSTIR